MTPETLLTIYGTKQLKQNGYTIHPLGKNLTLFSSDFEYADNGTWEQICESLGIPKDTTAVNLKIVGIDIEEYFD
jgi:hypothetical protein